MKKNRMKGYLVALFSIAFPLFTSSQASASPFAEPLTIGLEYLKALGWTKGVFALFFFGMHFWVYKLYDGRVKDRQGEIDRLAAENREYRDRFTHMLDKHHGYKPESRKGKGG